MANFPKCTLRDDFGRLLSSGQMADVHFVVGGGGIGEEGETVVPAHVAMVAARSKHLRDKIRQAKEAREEGQEDVLRVDLPEAVDGRAFRLVLEFIYTDKIDPTGGDRSMAGSNQVVRAMMVRGVKFFLDSPVLTK